MLVCPRHLFGRNFRGTNFDQMGTYSNEIWNVGRLIYPPPPLVALALILTVPLRRGKCYERRIDGISPPDRKYRKNAKMISPEIDDRPPKNTEERRNER